MGSAIVDETRTHIRAAIVKAVMDGIDGEIKAEEVGDGGAGVFATHRVTYRKTVAYVQSEDDAKTLEAAFKALTLHLAVMFASELTGGKPMGGEGGE